MESSLKLVNKIISDYKKLTLYPVMMVSLAAQGVGKTRGNVLNDFGPEETARTH